MVPTRMNSVVRARIRRISTGLREVNSTPNPCPPATHTEKKRRNEVTLCPIALVVGCKKCPAFSVCPLKAVIGDYRKEEKTQTKQHSDKAKK